MTALIVGHPGSITFGADSSVSLWPKKITPFGLKIGIVDTTNLGNAEYMTKAGHVLKEITPLKAKCAYHPSVLDEIKAMLGVNQQIIVTYPGGSKHTVYGILTEFQQDELNSDPTQPTADITIEGSAWTGSAESAPAYSAS